MPHIYCFVTDGYEADDDETDKSSLPMAAPVSILGDERAAEMTKQRRRDTNRAPTTVFDLLPDKLLGDFGKKIGVLCGPRDFVSLAKTCRRMHGIFLVSPEVVSSFIKARLRCFVKNPPAKCPGHESPTFYSLWKMASGIVTLEQAALFEELYGWGLLGPWKNRLCFSPLKTRRHDRVAWSCGAMSDGGNFQINVIWQILKSYPSVSVYWDVHGGSALPSDDQVHEEETKMFEEIFLEDLTRQEFANRVTYSPQGKRPTKSLRGCTIRGKQAEEIDVIFVDFYFRIPAPNGDFLEFPRRRSCYEGIHPGGYR
ncbi:hypothetical protein IV203_008183 [Nitzschia inconspicua]|uniref:Uncharacterized protein n=1 Tax=Nitzschia inconspicua TaxID=303405 RepID=A0A9K3PLQ3_9STRA|nr:hypothetical protein IV203_011091 [Nitzschia inconspicua]KAG7352135.1 hypothetical protein IV203_008183 [Nitzschia inconspicua]